MRVTSFYFVLLLPSYICKLIQGHFCYLFFFFNATATTEIYTLSLHDALPISRRQSRRGQARIKCSAGEEGSDGHSGARGQRGKTKGWIPPVANSVGSREGAAGAALSTCHF